MPNFTLDAAPTITEADGKFVINIPDSIAKSAEEFDKVNNQLSTINSKLTDYEKQLKAFGDNTPESFIEMQNKISAYSEKGDPNQLNLDLATATQANSTLKAEMEAMQNLNKELAGFKNNTVIGGAISSEMDKKLSENAGKYKEVYKNWVNEFNLNSDNNPVTKEGFTVSQFIEAKLARFDALGKKEQNGRVLSERLEVAAQIKELTNN